MKDTLVRPGSAMKFLIGGILIVGIISLFVIYRIKSAPQLYRQSEFLLDTFVEMTVASRNEQEAYTSMAAAYEEMRRIEALLSRYQRESQISEINQHAGEEQAVRVNREVVAIVQRSLRYAELTDGAFDITIGPVIDLWGIGTEHERVPGKSELQHILQYVDHRNVEILEEEGVRLQYPEMTLDLGGMAKGYSIDQAVDVLLCHNITSALLNAGGDIKCIGAKPDGAPWRIGIQHPRKKSEILGTVQLQDGAVATSGDYERAFFQGNTRFHHIFTPQTGMPARECQSVTVLTQTAEAADVLATAVFIMGPKKGLEFIEEQIHVEGMIIRSDGEMITSSGFSLEQVK